MVVGGWSAGFRAGAELEGESVAANRESVGTVAAGAVGEKQEAAIDLYIQGIALQHDLTRISALHLVGGFFPRVLAPRCIGTSCRGIREAGDRVRPGAGPPPAVWTVPLTPRVP